MNFERGKTVYEAAKIGRLANAPVLVSTMEFKSSSFMEPSKLKTVRKILKKLTKDSSHYEGYFGAVYFKFEERVTVDQKNSRHLNDYTTELKNMAGMDIVWKGRLYSLKPL